MINAQTVSDAITAHLVDFITEPGRFATAPDGMPAAYFVVERPPGSMADGSLGCPEADLLYRFRIRAVVRFADKEQAARAAEDLGARCAARFLDRTVAITGTGWEVSGRALIADAGTDGQGDVANHVADYEALVAATAT